MNSRQFKDPVSHMYHMYLADTVVASWPQTREGTGLNPSTNDKYFSH